MEPTESGGRALPPVLRVLVVDDDPVSRRLIERWLQPIGAVETIAAENGLEGLEAAISQHPDLAVIDLRLPVIDGLQLLELIRTNPSCDRIPVVIISAHGRERDVARAVSLGIWDFIVKPFNASNVQRRLEHAVRAVRERRYAGDSSGAAGAHVLVIDPDPEFRRFAVRALQPPLLLETASTTVQGAASALTRRPALVLAHESYHAALARSFERTGAGSHGAPRMLKLVSDPNQIGLQSLLRTYHRSTLLTQVVRALAEVSGRSFELVPGERSLGAVADHALRRFFQSMVGDGVADSAAAFEVAQSASIELHRGGSPLRLRYGIEAAAGFADALMRALLTDHDEPIENEDRDSALREVANLVGARLRSFAFEQRLRLDADLPRLAGGPLNRPAAVLYAWERSYAWRGERFRTRGEIYDPDGEADPGREPVDPGAASTLVATS